ncbi:4-hydroxy-tetrahydrodipicolinate reductase [Bryobacter aggregatus]|uniref:4-hydroxy-tetrahydrodipicolinate reductase n=1 Tax=Bryobacter aggregatus TaxID=360054 RepID=UPI0004E164F8|nr:dihydrodipicolinate reductase C-terminal domain-containing protein [Bryobacter aggregatus]
MKIAMVGYGKMGKMIESLAGEYGGEVVLKLDEFNNAGQALMTPEHFQGIDVAIEFTTPHTAVPNILKLQELGVPTVVGSTGWLEELPSVTEAVQAKKGALVWSPNFSIGVNLFFAAVKQLSAQMEEFPEYGAWAWEIHHSAKKDAPSGTLKMAVEQMRRGGYTREVSESSNRAGSVPGTHEIGFDSAADTITLRHTARSREGFARGALKAAQWIQGRTGVYEFGEILFQK